MDLCGEMAVHKEVRVECVRQVNYKMQSVDVYTNNHEHARVLCVICVMFNVQAPAHV